MKFTVGDIVKYASGSPRMTIEAINGEIATCGWFNEHKYQTIDFRTELLVLQNDEPMAIEDTRRD
jgi:uncharacterized protein YodC (DUF2158 family)